MRIEKAKRIVELPPYLFAAIDKKKVEMRKKGMDLIDLGIGDPDLPTPQPIIERLKKAAENRAHHRYPSYEGMIDFRKAVARWYERRFGVQLDPETEVLSLIGSKEGIAHIPLAFVNPGDYVLVPNPGYPVYRVATLFAGGIPHFLPLRKEHRFLPDLSKIPTEVREKAKLLFINYPNNPTSATAEKSFFEEVVAFANRYQIIVCHDAAYSEVAFDRDIIRDLRGIRERGKLAGISLNPPTPVSEIEPVLEEVDQVLVMSVHPGFAGQEFMEDALLKIETLAKRKAKSGATLTYPGGRWNQLGNDTPRVYRRRGRDHRRKRDLRRRKPGSRLSGVTPDNVGEFRLMLLEMNDYFILFHTVAPFSVLAPH